MNSTLFRSISRSHAVFFLLPTLWIGSGQRAEAGPFDFRSQRELLVPPRGGNIGLLSGLAVVDLDRDGRLDIVASLEQPNRIRAFLNDGHATFPRETSLTPPFRPGRLAPGDFDEDGSPDLIVTIPDIDRIGLLRSNATGNLNLAGTFDVGGSSPLELVVEDFDFDGHLDVAVTHELSFSISVLLGDGTGGFSPPTVVGSLGIRPTALATQDFDEDGNLDLAVVHSQSNNIALLRGDGTGRFLPYFFDSVGQEPRSVACSDLNGDGHADLAIAEEAEGVVRILLGNGSGLFPSTVRLRPGNDPRAIQVADGNRDGLPDLYVATESNSQVRVFRNTGTAFEESLFAVGEAPFLLRTGDLDRDGHLDVITANRTEASITVVLGEGRGELVTHEPVGTSSPLLFGSVSSGDVNEDGFDDVVASGTSGYVLFLSDGTGGGSIESLDLQGGLRGLADVVEDGHLDLVLGSGSTLIVHPGDGSGSFGPPIITNGGGNGGGPIIDVDQDGHLDFVGQSPGFVTIAFGDGAGEIRGSATYRRDCFFSQDALATGDFNGDDLLDVAVSGSNDDCIPGAYLEIRSGQGGGTLGPPSYIVLPFEEPWALLAADLDQDGFDELIVSDWLLDRIHVLKGNPVRLDPLDPITVGAGPTEMACSDFDEDGDLDVAVLITRPVGGEFAVTLLEGDGTGTLSPTVNLWIPGEAAIDDLTALDADGDGHQDLGVLSRSFPESAITVLRNRTLDHLDARRGNVNAATGPVADVLFANGSAGTGLKRHIPVNVDTPLALEIVAPPSRAHAMGTRYAVYGFVGRPRVSTAERLPFDIGRACRSMPLSGGGPEAVWSTFPNCAVFGKPTHPSNPAPTTLLNLAQGVGFTINFTIQGLVADSAAPNGLLAVTNALVVKVR